VSAANAGAPVPPVRFSPSLADPEPAGPSAGAGRAADRPPVAAAPKRSRAKDREPVELGASRDMILQAAKANADQLAGRLPVRRERHSAASVPEPAPIQLTAPGGAPSRSTGLFQVLANYLLPPSGPPTGVLYLLVNLAWVLMAAALVAPRFLMLRLPDLPSSRRAGYRAVALRPG
jgi:hypothetical protein